MPIDFECTNCSHKQRVPDEIAGKRVKCPRCHEVLRVPGQQGGDVQAVSEEDASEPLADDKPLWQLRIADGSVYGPVDREELDHWLSEGRITAECQILPDGDEQWRWAAEVYPDLAAAAATPPPPPDATLRQTVPTVGPVIARIVQTPETPTVPALPRQGSERGGKWSDPAPPSFRGRIYPAMLLTSKFYRSLGWVVIFISGIAAFFSIIAIGGVVSTQEMEGVELASYLGLSLLAILGAGIYVAVVVVTLWFAAEAIKCLLDIEDNTHRTSFNLQHITKREGSD